MIYEDYLKLNNYKLFFRFLKKSKNPDSPVLIFLHDSWGCTEMWEDFPEKTAQLFGLNALIYDRRGYGKSSAFSAVKRTKTYLHEAADELMSVMNKLEIREAILYGHSDGGTIALIASAVYPERFHGILVEGAHSFVEEKGKKAVRESRDKAKHNSLLSSLAKFHGDKTEELFRRWHEAWLDKNFADWNIVPVLQNITCPVLAFRGEDDPYDTVEQINVLKREINSPILTKVISNATHTPRKENEDETKGLIHTFFFNYLKK